MAFCVLRHRTPKIGWRYASVFGDMCLGSDAYRRVYHDEFSPLAKCVLQLKNRLRVCISLVSLSHTNPGLPPASSIFSFIPLGLSLFYLYVSIPLLFSLSFYLLSLSLSLSLVLTAEYILFTFYLSSRISAHICLPPPLLLFLVPLSINRPPPPLPPPSLSLSLPLHVY